MLLDTSEYIHDKRKGKSTVLTCLGDRHLTFSTLDVGFVRSFLWPYALIVLGVV